MKFSDLEPVARMSIRAALESCGATCCGYHGDYAQFALPRLDDLQALFFIECEKHSLSISPAAMHYFPLGSDTAPKYQRHDGSYPGSRGFWLYCSVKPKSPSNDLN